MTKKQRIVAAAREVGGASKAEYVEKCLVFHSDKGLTRSVIEGIFIEAGFDYSLDQVMAKAGSDMSADLKRHYRKQGL
jgi:hypothetical protein